MVNQMVRAIKNKIEGKHLYINILDFKDEGEQEAIFKEVEGILKKYQGEINGS